MARKIDPRYSNTFVDVPVLHRKGNAEDAVFDEVLEIAFEWRVMLHLTYSVKDEIAHPNTPDYVKKRAQRFIYSVPVQLTQEENELHQKVRKIVQGNAKAGKHDADAFHLVESQKYGAGHFLTYDKRLLKKKAAIRNLLNMEIVTPTEFLAVLKKFEQSET